MLESDDIWINKQHRTGRTPGVASKSVIRLLISEMLRQPLSQLG